MGPMPATAPFCPSSLPSPPLLLKSYGLAFGGGQRKELRTEPLASTQQGVIMSCSWKISPLEHCQRPVQRPDWSGTGVGLHDPNSKEGCKMGPLGFRLGVCKSPDGRVKEAAHALVTIQCGDHTVMMSCLAAPVLTNICFVQGARTRTPKDTQKCRT